MRTYLMVVMMAFGCGKAESGKDAPAAIPVPSPAADPVTMQSMLVETEAGLPACDASRAQQLVYVTDVQQFRACTNGQWAAVSIKGEKGDKGDKGEATPSNGSLVAYDIRCRYGVSEEDATAAGLNRDIYILVVVSVLKSGDALITRALGGYTTHRQPAITFTTLWPNATASTEPLVFNSLVDTAGAVDDGGFWKHTVNLTTLEAAHFYGDTGINHFFPPQTCTKVEF